MEAGQKKASLEQEKILKQLEDLEKRNEPLRGPKNKPIEHGSDDQIMLGQFMKACRSLHISPVEAHLANLKDFFLAMMDMTEELGANLELSDIRKIHPRKMPAHRIASDSTKKSTSHSGMPRGVFFRHPGHELSSS